MEDTFGGCEEIIPQGMIEEEVYIEKPEGFETFDRDSHVCKLKQAVYGLKQAPNAWYTRLSEWVTCLLRVLLMMLDDCM